MNLSMLLAVAALVASVLLLMQLKTRLYPLIAVAVSGLEVLMALGVIRFGIANVPLPMIIGGALAVTGVLMWLKAGGKTPVSAATVVATVGAIQLFTGVLPR